MKKTQVATLLLFAVLNTSHAQVMGHNSPKAESQGNDNVAKIETKDEGINFDEWESDFYKSVKKTPQDCKGQNCQFKNKQALDPSFDF